MERHATLYTREGKQYLVARLEVDNDEDPAELALWIGQCLQEGRMLEIEEGLVLERTTGNRWRVSFQPGLDPCPPPRLERPGAAPIAEAEPLPGRRNGSVPALPHAPLRETLLVGEPEPEEPEEPEPEPELRPDPVLARALGLASAAAAAPSPSTLPSESPEERRERLLNRHSPLPTGRTASARENEERALRFMGLGANTADRVAAALGVTREGGRKLLERLVKEGRLQRTAVPSMWKAKGVAASIVYYHLPGQPLPDEAAGSGPITSDQKILTALAVAPMTVQELVDATGHSAHTVRHRLKRLQGERKVRELHHSGVPCWART